MIKVDKRSKDSVYITIGKWVIYIDNSTGEQIIDKIVVLRGRRQFIVNNLIQAIPLRTDIGEMEEYEHKKTNDNK